MRIGCCYSKCTRFFLIFFCCFIGGCAEFDRFAKDLTKATSCPNPVTGARELSLMNEQKEIEVGTKEESECIQKFQSQGLAVDEDKETLAKLQVMLSKITHVSHRPNLPWEIHIVDTDPINAFAIPGGKIFVLKGLIGNLVLSDDELAGVLAHEVAHVTCRHTVTQQASSLVMSMIEKKTRQGIYKASYSTLQEDQADKVGLLYMAMAGYNPEVMYGIWKRADQKYGSNPDNYLYDHSLNNDRANKVSQIIPIAKEYFKGEGVQNANFNNVLIENKVVPRTEFKTDSGLAALSEVSLNTYVQYLKTKNEQKNREKEKEQNESYLQFARLSNVQQQSTSDGKIGLFANVTNASNTNMKKVRVTVYYVDSANKVLYTEAQDLSNIPSSQTAQAGFYLKNVPNYKDVRIGVTNVEF